MGYDLGQLAEALKLVAAETPPAVAEQPRIEPAGEPQAFRALKRLAFAWLEAVREEMLRWGRKAGGYNGSRPASLRRAPCCVPVAYHKTPRVLGPGRVGAPERPARASATLDAGQPGSAIVGERRGESRPDALTTTTPLDSEPASQAATAAVTPAGARQ